MEFKNETLRSENLYLHLKKKQPYNLLAARRQCRSLHHCFTHRKCYIEVMIYSKLQAFSPNKCVLFSVRDCKTSIVKWPWLLFLFFCIIIMDESLKQWSPMQTESKYYSRSRVCPCLNRYMPCIFTHWLLIYLLN